MNALSKSSGTFFRFFVGLLILPALALADVPDRVGRIAYLAGDVRFYSEGAQGWVPAELNTPVTSRNSLFTGPDGHAEVRFGSAAATLDANTQFDIHVLDDQAFKAGVGRGSVNFRVPAFDSDESYEVVATPASYKLLQAGRYRIDADSPESSVTVFAGLAAARNSATSVMVGGGKSLSTSGGDFRFGHASRTLVDVLAAERDEAMRATEATRYVSPNMTGYEELDANGRWVSDPEYGTVWYPTTYISPGWSPYREGRWAYVAPWGWCCRLRASVEIWRQ